MARTTPVNAGYTIANGAGTGTNGSRIDVWVEYKAGTPNAENNTTPFTAYFYTALRTGQSSSTQMTYGLNSKFTVDGVSGSVVSSGAYDFTSPDNIHTLGSYSGNIAHNSDGTKTIQIVGSFTTLSEYISGGSISVTVVLPVIPRASTVGATDASIGSVSMIAVGRKSSGYTHSVHYQFGAVSGYVTASGGISASEVKLSETSIPFKIPDSFYGQIPNAKSGVCTLICRTYSGSTQIGDAQTATFIATAAEALSCPVVSGTVVDTNSATKALTGDANKLVRYMSTALCTISAAARNSASIVSKAIGGVSVSGDTLTIAGVEGGSVAFWTKDSRGYEAVHTVTKTLIPYVRLTSNPTAVRTSPTGGEAVLTLSGDYYNASFGASANTLTARYRVNGGAWVSAAPVISGNAYTASVSLTGLDYTAQHTIDIEVSDRLTTVAKTVVLKRGLPVFDWGENDFVFHVPVYFGSASYDAGTGKLTIS